MKAKILWLVPDSLRAPRDHEAPGTARARTTCAGIVRQPRRGLRMRWQRSALTGRPEMRWVAEDAGSQASPGSSESASAGEPGSGRTAAA